MRIFQTFSKRQKALRGEIPDVYSYDKLPEQLRVQIVHIIRDAFGTDNYGQNCASLAYQEINNVLCREYGVFSLTKYASSPEEYIFNFFLREESVEKAFDVVEICFLFINLKIAEDDYYQYHTNRKVTPSEAINELNERFKEHGIGYRFESNKIIRIDSDFVHSEAIKPTLLLLREKEFKGANEEFLLAHEHYRHKRYKECLVDSLKSFESTMKAICTKKKWPISPQDTAKTLIATCFKNGLFPQYFETQFSSLRTLLESGIPTVRNKNGAHGQGSELIIVPEHLARYAINLTATTILFFIEASR